LRNEYAKYFKNLLATPQNLLATFETRQHFLEFGWQLCEFAGTRRNSFSTLRKKEALPQIAAALLF
jgi:hypothetical protein